MLLSPRCEETVCVHACMVNLAISIHPPTSATDILRRWFRVYQVAQIVRSAVHSC